MSRGIVQVMRGNHTKIGNCARALTEFGYRIAIFSAKARKIPSSLAEDVLQILNFLITISTRDGDIVYNDGH